MPLEGSGVRQEAPGTRPLQDLEYGSAVLRKPKKKTVSIFRYLCACFAVVSHFSFIVLTAWVSCSFARWEEMDEPLQEPIQLRIVAGTHSEQADCWNPATFLGVHRPGTARASGFCEMRASSLASNRFRSFVALMLGPVVVIETVLHWFQGTHFPLTASQSFFVVSTGREMERKVPVVDVASILILTSESAGIYHVPINWENPIGGGSPQSLWQKEELQARLPFCCSVAVLLRSSLSWLYCRFPREFGIRRMRFGCRRVPSNGNFLLLLWYVEHCSPLHEGT
ncbi:unnamed protein product [Symbiodinium sp. CCMP2456]|nr:unnamed protein product [Symbiodinium sp. CCMP2456]